MKKIGCFVGALLIAFSLSGCSCENVYNVFNENCIVSVPEIFILSNLLKKQ